MVEKPRIRPNLSDVEARRKFVALRERVKKTGLKTVCQEAHCPNMAECWGGGTATFMILGDICTRGCKFCHVKTGYPRGLINPLEPRLLARSIRDLELDYAVITSVDRDDLPDGGSGHFAACVTEIKRRSPSTVIEVLIPDFRGDRTALAKIITAAPAVIAQNLETVERLTHEVRDPRAGYRQTLEVLAYVKEKNPLIYTKSSLIVGFGEREEEILTALNDLRLQGVDFVTIGQYLRPGDGHYPLREYITTEQFLRYEELALKMGFLYAFCGPLVRGSYRAGEYFARRRAAQN